MQRRGHLRIVEDEPPPQPADAGARPPITGWTIVEGAAIAGEPRSVEIAGWRAAHDVGSAPDWLCESAEADRAAQLARYAARAIGHVWLLDAATRTIDIYRFASGRYAQVATARGDVRVRAEPFDAFDLDLSSVWSDDAS